jgi:hypothetical protein
VTQWDALETPLSQEPLFAIEPKDSSPASELDRQAEFRRLCAILMPAVMLIAVPNGGKRGLGAQRQIKREGVRAGTPDMIAVAPRKLAFLEFKAGRTMPSAAQIETMNRLHRMGHAVGVFRTADAAIAFLRKQGFA